MSDTAGHLWKVIEPYVVAEGVELDDIEIVGGEGAAIVRVTVDADDPVDVDRIARLSRGVSRLLDESDPFRGSYTLEVSSPGLERKLRRPRHFQKAIGRRVKAKSRKPVGDAHTHEGVLTSADDGAFVLDTEEGMRTIAYEDVTSARTVFVWEKKTKPGSRP